MKKLIYGTLFLAIVGIGFVACEKEEIVSDSKEVINNLVENRSSTSTGITNINGILHFIDNNHVINTLSQLTDDYNQGEMIFLNNNEGAEDLFEAEINSGYNENLVFELFEQDLNFSSLRQDLHSMYLNWVDAEVQLEEFNPDNNFVLETSVQTILNADYELSIGGILYKFFKGGYIQIMMEISTN